MRCCNSITSRITSHSTAMWSKRSPGKNIHLKMIFFKFWILIEFYTFTSMAATLLPLWIQQSTIWLDHEQAKHQTIHEKRLMRFVSLWCYAVCHGEFVIQRSNHKRVDRLVITYYTAVALLAKELKSPQVMYRLI